MVSSLMLKCFMFHFAGSEVFLDGDVLVIFLAISRKCVSIRGVSSYYSSSLLSFS